MSSHREKAAQALRHHQSGALVEAELLYRAVLAVRPDHADSLYGMGVLARGSGRAEVAVAFIGRAIRSRPEAGHYYVDLGLALRELGHLEPARAALAVAVLRVPDDPRARLGLAMALDALGRDGEAADQAEAAIRLDGQGGDVAAWHLLATLQGRLGRLDEAEAAFRRTMALRPQDPAPVANLGGLLFERGRLDEALLLLREAARLGDPTAATRSNLGLVLMALGQLVEAEQELAAAADLAPDQDGILVNQASLLIELGRGDEADRCLERVLQQADPGSADAARARFNRSTIRLGEGRLSEGWVDFEARRGLLPRPAVALPDWDGGVLPPGGTVLLTVEQGLGDALQFLRAVPAASERAPVILVLPPPLLRLGRSLHSDRCRVVADGDPAIAICSVQASLLSLPHLLQQWAPAPVAPYLQAPAAELARWRDWTGRLPGLRVGLCWAGSPGYRFDRRRSIPRAALQPLVGIPGVTLVSLQPGAGPDPDLVAPHVPLDDLATTAGLLACLELVISVDTSIAHLGGALGRPVWLLNRYGGDWRWRDGLLDPDGRSLLYPSVRQFRQARPLPPEQAWQEPVARVAAALRLAAAR